MTIEWRGSPRETPTTRWAIVSIETYSPECPGIRARPRKGDDRPMEALEGQEAWIFAPPTSHSCPKIVGTV
jgi:hypothetical protein